jgi:hypothetical protein
MVALVREGEGIAAGVQESLGLTLEQVRIATIRMLGIPASSGLEAELARVEQLQKRVQAIIAVEGFTPDRPLAEQFEERIKELREQIAKEQQEREQGHSAEPKKPEEEDK